MNPQQTTLISQQLRERIIDFKTKHQGHPLLKDSPEAANGVIPATRETQFGTFMIVSFLTIISWTVLSVSLGVKYKFTVLGLGTILVPYLFILRRFNHIWHPVNARSRGHLSMKEIRVEERGEYLLMIENTLILTENFVLYNLHSVKNAPKYFNHGKGDTADDSQRKVYDLQHHVVKDVLYSNEPVTLDSTLTSAKWNWDTLVTDENRTLLQDLAALFDDLQKSIREKEAHEQEVFNQRREELLAHYDSDSNGTLDLVENDKQFEQILTLNEVKITEIDRAYMQQFVKIGVHIAKLKTELQTLFSKLENAESLQKLENLNALLEEELHNFNLIQLSSLAMVTCLVENRMIDFYKIHEVFDELGLFETSFERNIMTRLDQIEYRIDQVSANLHSKLSSLKSISEANNKAMQKQLESVNSSLKVNNLLTAVNTYNTYKTHKIVKSLNK